MQVWLEGKELHGAFDPVRTSVGQSGSGSEVREEHGYLTKVERQA